MKTSDSELEVLMQLQALDSQTDTVTRQANNAELRERIAAARDEATQLTTLLRSSLAKADEARAELARLEQDTQIVIARIDRDQQLIQESASTKDIQGLSSELDNLAKRQAELEDQQLELMSVAEEETQRLAEQKRVHAASVAEVERLQQQAQAEAAQLKITLSAFAAQRETLVKKISAELVTLYDRVRARTGFGVGRLTRGGVCGACNMQLGPSELAGVQAQPGDQLVRCPECDAILVRLAAAE